VRLPHICVTHSVVRGCTASYDNLWADWCGSVARSLGRGLLQGATRVPTLGVWSALGQREHWLFCTRATASRLTLFNSTTQNRPTKHLLMAHGMPAGGATETGIKNDGTAADPFNMYRDAMVEGQVWLQPVTLPSFRWAFRS